MKTSTTHDQRIATLTFASVYPLYLQKVEKKGRTKAELHQVITWLTNFDDQTLQELIDAQATFQNFHLGVGGPDCAGPTFENFCAHATNETIPDDRLILTLETVTPRREDGGQIYVRRLSVRDTSKSAEPVTTATRFIFSHYSGLLNIAWGENGFYLRRTGLPDRKSVV